jgi:hypothetical protein
MPTLKVALAARAEALAGAVPLDNARQWIESQIAKDRTLNWETRFGRRRMRRSPRDGLMTSAINWDDEVRKAAHEALSS